jgi:peptidoglycan/xylan/chitin deacetylase (PgdA/CDA1 family)
MRKIVRDSLLSFMGAFRRAKPGIHIINSHYVTSGFHNKDEDWEMFDSYLKFLTTIGKLCNIEDALLKMQKNEIGGKEVQIVLTFDDGFEECYTVIAPLLEKYGVRGSFFINANYIESGMSYQNQFSKRIHLNSKKPMSWAQVKDLHDRGHLIGSHTLDHENLSNLSEEDIEVQIVKNKEVLEQKIQYHCEHFAWPYGREVDFPSEAFLIVKKNHKYIFSSANYNKYYSRGTSIINRRHLEPFWPVPHIKYFLSVNKK